MSVVSLIARRYGFTPRNRHRHASVRILVSTALCVLALHLSMAFMQQLGDHRLEQIRVFESFDIRIGCKSRQEAEEIAETEGGFLFAEEPVLLKGEEPEMVIGRYISSDAPMFNSFVHRIGSADGLQLSSSLAAKTGLRSTASLVTVREGKRVKVVPSCKEYDIAGFFYSGDNEFDYHYVVLPLSAAGGDVKWQVGFSSLENPDRRAAELGAKYGEVKTYKQLNRSLYSALMLERMLLNLLFLMLITVVLFSLKRSVRRLVLYKSGEIGMLGTLGLSRRKIRRIFVLQSVMVLSLALGAAWLLTYLVVAASPAISTLLSRHSYLFVPHQRLVFPALRAAGFSLLILGLGVLFSFTGCNALLKRSIMEMIDAESD